MSAEVLSLHRDSSAKCFGKIYIKGKMNDPNFRSADKAIPSNAYSERRESEGWLIQRAADELVEVVNASANRLGRVDSMTAATTPAPGKWSVQEIIGHLIDSAANNHQRFVRAQHGVAVDLPGYAQDFWVVVQGYSQSPWPELVEFWRLYNLHLARIMRCVPAEMLDVECRIGPEEPVPLGFVIEDYVAHLKHHLLQIEGLLRT